MAPLYSEGGSVEQFRVEEIPKSDKALAVERLTALRASYAAELTDSLTSATTNEVSVLDLFLDRAQAVSGVQFPVGHRVDPETTRLVRVSVPVEPDIKTQFAVLANDSENKPLLVVADGTVHPCAFNMDRLGGANIGTVSAISLPIGDKVATLFVGAQKKADEKGCLAVNVEQHFSPMPTVSLFLTTDLVAKGFETQDFIKNHLDSFSKALVDSDSAIRINDVYSAIKRPITDSLERSGKVIEFFNKVKPFKSIYIPDLDK
jgi:hypothetical protein